MRGDLSRALGGVAVILAVLALYSFSPIHAQTDGAPAADTAEAGDDVASPEVADEGDAADDADTGPDDAPGDLAEAGEDAAPEVPPALLSLLTARSEVPEPVPASASSTPQRLGSETGFPLPRYVSLGASEANARRGPSRSHRIDWVFTRRGMPVMIVAEHGHWRRVVDRDGVGGWMHYSLLSGVRSAIVEEDMLPLYSRPDTGSQVRARAEMGVIGRLRECQPGWCLMEVGGYRGWVETSALWGVDPGETFD